MTEQPRLLDAYRRAREAASPVPSRTPTEDGEPPWTAMAEALEAAGWDRQVRMGKRIWCRSRDDPSCGWKNEEIAYVWMKRGEA